MDVNILLHPFGEISMERRWRVAATTLRRETSVMKPVIRKIEMVVEHSGMLVGEFTAAAGLAVNRYAKWRDGKGEPKVSQLVRIARVLNVPIDWLADDDQPIDAVPEPKWTREELLVLEAIRSIGTHEALRRLLRADAAPPVPSGEAAPVAQRLHPKGFDPLPCEPSPAKPKPKKRG